ncbi:thioesterase family protein [Alistipes sp.]|uniref:acyl-CoA thioesterase n=1 Tax=Alistipes sp. TaxID=1872444 RepID=UPI0025BF12A5|nr:thioesterase family protein [Alistipes sp.]
MAYTLETPIQKRFSDVDPFQHVNNVAQQMYFDVGKSEFFEKVLNEEVLLADLRILTASTSTSYLGQIRMHDPVRVTTTCERVGTKSLTLFQQLLVGDQVRSESRSVMVVFDFAAQRSQPVPDVWRKRLLADQLP